MITLLNGNVIQTTIMQVKISMPMGSLRLHHPLSLWASYRQGAEMMSPGCEQDTSTLTTDCLGAGGIMPLAWE